MDKSLLRAYCKIFKSVEIDSTFYRYPSKGTVMGWTRYSPEEFVFAAKLPGLITHDKKLQITEGIGEDLDRFIELMEPLTSSGKLGCVLIQLPPSFNYRLEELEEFLKLLPTHVRFAIEFRDSSWLRGETWPLLRKYKVTYTIVDEPLLPSEIHLTSDIAYFRWHGRGKRPWYDYRYTLEELQPWIHKIKEVAPKVEKIYGFFNNHFHGYAVENCLQVMEMFGSLDSKQLEAKARIENYRKNLSQPVPSTLESFLVPKGDNFQNLMRYFVPSERLRRAEQIPDQELHFGVQTNERIEATLKEYRIIVDLVNKTIFHDCADWTRVGSMRKLCKHVAKLFLTIDREKATAILRNMTNNEDAWQFKQFPGA